MPKKSTIEPYEVGNSWRVIVPRDIAGDGKRQTRWFKKKRDALEECARLQGQRDDIGAALYQIGKVDQGKLCQALKLAGSASAVLEAVQFHQMQRPDTAIELPELAKRVVTAKEMSGKSEHYARCLARNLSLFCAGREEKKAHEIQPHDIENWINSNPQWTQFTKQTYLRDVKTMFSFAVKNGMVVSNPALRVEKPAMADTPPQILSVENSERLMRSAATKDPKLVQYLALCLFGGLRPSEAFKVQPENMKNGHVEVFGKKVRARNRRLVTINPTLKAWLERYPGDYSPVNLQRRLRAVRGDIPWSQDCMRHSFVSNFYAIHGAAETSKEAGHSESVLFRHYRETVSKQDAERFWSILPSKTDA